MSELESMIEKKLIEQLIYGDSQWTYREDLKTEEDLWANFRYILEQNNKDRLDGEGLSDSEFEQVKNQLQFSSFYKAGEWLVGENGKVMVHVQRDMEKLHLVVMNHEHIAGGSSVYEVINQYKALKSDDEDSTDVRDRRFDVTLMINGLPMIHIELKPYFDRDEEIVDRVIDAVLDAGLEEKAVLTSFEYGTLRRVKERMPQMATCAMTLSPESQLIQPATFWEKLGLKKTDPLVEKLSSPQALSEAAALLEDPSSLDEEEQAYLIYYLKDRLEFSLLHLPRHEPGRNSAAVLLSDGFCELCGPVRLPGGLRRAGVPRLFPGQRPCPQRPRPRRSRSAPVAGGQ